jgi:crotonobetainyl-CoA:carnitine CoA-transferase CaiB-like acyl-CoA transferase
MTSFADRASLIAALEDAGVAWAELADSADVFAGGAHSVRLPGSERRVVALPYAFSAATATVRRGVARRGEHNTEALADWLDLDEAEVAALTATGVLLGS